MQELSCALEWWKTAYCRFTYVDEVEIHKHNDGVKKNKTLLHLHNLHSRHYIKKWSAH